MYTVNVLNKSGRYRLSFWRTVLYMEAYSDFK